MRPRFLGFLAFSFVAGATMAVAAAQTPAPSAESDGLIHAEVTLDAQTISVAFAPNLSADDRVHQALLAGTVGSRVRVGTLAGHAALRLGSLAPELEMADAAEPADDDSSPAGPSYTLWLVRNTQGWELEAHTAETDDVGIIPLTHRSTDLPAETFTASLHPTAAEAGRLALRWGRHAWSTDFRFDELPPRPPRPRVSGRGTARQPDTDTTGLSRGSTLAERNESALVLADGARISALYWKGIDPEDEDYGQVATTAEGAVVRLVRAAPLRVKTDVALRFGQTEVPTGNLAPGFAGAYAVWLRKSGDGWRLAFNDEPDSWGTQHDPSFDRAEIDVAYSRGDGSFRPLGATLVPTGANSGQLLVHWGPHEWTADFTFSR